jgi:hypothetical protein
MTKPFRGVINVDVTQSVPDWEPYTQPIAPEGTPNVLYIVLDDVGYSAMEPYGGLAARDVPLGLAHVHGPALEMAERSGLLASVGADRVFPATPAAVAWAQSVADAPAPGLCCLRGGRPPAPPG